MNVTFYPAIRLVQIENIFYTIKELERKRTRTRIETTILQNAKRIFSVKRRKKAKLYKKDQEELDILVESDLAKGDYHSIHLRSHSL